jgi:uncharacterized LabA/DUF88 family protein
MSKGIVAVDGSRLFSEIFEIRRSRNAPNLQCNITALSNHLRFVWRNVLGEFIRATYYFKQQDKRIKEMLKVDQDREHWKIVECGIPLPAIPDEELAKLSPKYRDHFPRSEKGVDIKLTCDCLSLAATGRVDSFIFHFNDRDFLPLIEAIQGLGCNAYLTSLSIRPSQELIDACDRYTSMEGYLDAILHG